MTYTIAIKLGSCNTSIFKQGEGIVLFEPSLIAYAGQGKQREIIAIGNKAKKLQGRTGTSIVVESPIKNGSIADPELAVSMLKGFLTKVLTKSLFRPKISAVVCIPLGLSLNERKLFEKVCYQSGIQDVTLVPSIICGALGYNLPVTSPNGLCLVNIGGGSTDIAAISMASIITGVNIGVGGKQMDRSIEEAVLNNYSLLIGQGVAGALKEEIGSLYPNDSSNTEVSGLDDESKLVRSVVVESRTIYDAIKNYYETIASSILAVINACPPNIAEDIACHGIYLMGGCSLIVGAEQFFRKRLNLPVIVQDQTTAIDVIGAGKLLSDTKLLQKLGEL